jgi:carbonic anhydrase
VERFVSRQRQMLTRYPSVAQALEDESLTLHAWVYDLTTGLVRARDEDGVWCVPPEPDAEARAYE